jgi:hypothetical protein
MESVQREYIFLRRKRSCTSSRSNSSSDGGGNTNKSDIFTIACKTCEIERSSCSVDENSNLLGYNAVFLVE